MLVMGRNDELKTRPVSSTFPLTEEPEMRDSRIEETSEAASNHVRKRAEIARRIRHTQALAVAYDRDATCYENRLRKKTRSNLLAGRGRNTFGVAASVATRAFLRANLWSMKEREVDEGRGRGEGEGVGDLFMSWCPSLLSTPESGLARIPPQKFQSPTQSADLSPGAASPSSSHICRTQRLGPFISLRLHE